MSLGLSVEKIGMTRIFTDDGASLPVTVLDVSNNRITNAKTDATDVIIQCRLHLACDAPVRVTKQLRVITQKQELRLVVY